MQNASILFDSYTYLLKRYAALGLAALIIGGSLRAGTISSHRPNIVFILADDLGYGDLSCQNTASKIQTPRLDHLAGQGMRFTDAHAPSALCTPSRYGILTGQYCWRTRLKSGVLNSWDEPLIAPGRLTVAGLLKNNGYQTACFGKWHLGMAWPFVGAAPPGFDVNITPADIDWSGRIRGGPVDAGFDYYFGVNIANEPPYVFIENDHVLQAPTMVYPTVTGQQGHWAGPGVPGWDWTALLPQLTTNTVQWLEQAATNHQPFFLYASLVGPHQPVLPSKEFQGSSGAGVYGDYVQEIDWAVGQLLDALDRTGAATNTLVIFTSDNGPDEFSYDRLSQFQHASMGDLRGIKCDIWEGGHRVPFLARWPGNINAGTTNAQTICLLDFMRTVADVVQAPLAASAAEDSVSFLPALLGQGANASTNRLLVLESGIGQFGLRSNNWMFINSSTGDGHNPELEPDWFRTARQVSSLLSTQNCLLYNLEQDLAERFNLGGVDPAVTTLLQAQLIQQRSAVTWRGGVSGDWTNLNNWLPRGPTNQSDILYSNIANVVYFNQSLRGDFTINSLIVDSSVTSDVIIGSAAADGRLAIAHGINAGDASADLEIAAPVVLAESQIWSISVGHWLSVYGPVTIGNHELTICGNGNTYFSSCISGAGPLRLRNAGTNVLSGTNCFSGGTELSGGGLLIVQSDGALGAGPLTIPNNSTLQIAPNVTMTNPAAIKGSGTDLGDGPAGALTITRPGVATCAGPMMLLGSAAVRAAATGSTLNLAGPITGDGDLHVLSGAGTVTISTNQFYTGRTLVDGRLQLSGAPAFLPAGTDLIFADLAGAELDLGGTSQTVGSLAGGGSHGGNVVLGGATFTAAPGSTSIFGGSILGAGDFQKLGRGTLVLTGSNTWMGRTTIGSGVLIANGTLACNELMVAGGTLTGNGSISSQVTVANGGVLELAISSKPLGVTGSLSMAAQSITAVELNAASGASGGVQGMTLAAYGGTLLVTNTGTAFTNGQCFQLFAASQGSGNFARIQPDPGAGFAWKFDPAKGLLTVIARPQLRLTKLNSNSATFAWPGQGFHLQVLTNSLTLDAKWTDLPTSIVSPATIPIDPSQPGVFFRLASP